MIYISVAKTITNVSFLLQTNYTESTLILFYSREGERQRDNIVTLHSFHRY